VHARARATVSPEELDSIRSAYERTVGQPLTALIAHEIEDALADGMFAAVVMEAITVTGWAPRPSPYYLRAVLRRWRRDGVLTVDQLAADRAGHERAAAGSWWQTNPALRYEQRPIEGDGSEYFMDLSKYSNIRSSNA